VWNYTDTVGSPPARGVACRSLDQTGAANSGQLTLSTDASSVVSIAPLSNLNFVVAWQIGTPATIRTIIAKPDCTTLTTNPTNASTTAGATYGPVSAHVAANGTNLMYAWITDGDVYVRPGTNTGPSGAADIKLLLHTATQQAEGVRVAPLGTGFAIVVRWANPSGNGPGKIELNQVSPAGMTSGAQPTLISDQTRSDFVSGSQSPSVTTRSSDGALLVAWHQCDEQGSPGSCDVYGRMVRPNTTTSGPQFPLATTTAGDQTSPSVVALPDGSFAAAWNDQSHMGADMSGYAVRGRILYPAYDPNGSM
jgi:hypothetical protein